MNNNKTKERREMKLGDFERQVCTFNFYCPKLS